MELETLLKKIATPDRKNNQSPHTLDQQPSFVSACNQMKESLKELMYYAQDYNKHNFMTKKIVAKKINKKMNVILNTMSNYTRMVDNLAFTHN